MICMNGTSFKDCLTTVAAEICEKRKMGKKQIG